MASIEQRGENTYRIVVSVRKGNRFAKETKSIELSPNLTDKQKEKELKRLALLFEEDVKKGNYLDGEKITFADFTEIWLREYAEKELEPATLNPYKMRLEKRILPAIGHLKLTKIQPQHLISFYNNLTEEGIRLDISYLPTSEFLRLLENVNYSEIQAQTGLYRRIFTRLKQGKGIYLQNVEKLCEYFHIDKNDMNTFFVVKNLYWDAPFLGLFAPYFDLDWFLPATPVVSRDPLTIWYLQPGRSFTLPPLIRTTLCS